MEEFKIIRNLIIFLGGILYAQPDGWDFSPNEYEFQANMTAIVFMNNNLLTGENDWLGAFASGEIRGTQEAFLNELPISEYYEDYIFPIQLYANIDGEEFSFLFYDFSEDEEKEIVTNYTFLSNDVPGDLTEPIPLYLQELSNNAMANQNFQLISIYPNPFNSEVLVSYHVNTPTEVGFKVFDITGRLVDELGFNCYYSGDFNISWIGDFPSGNYFIMVYSRNQKNTYPVTLLK